MRTSECSDRKSIPEGAPVSRHDTDPEAAATRRRWQDTIETASRRTPESFQDEAYQAAALVDALDADPVAALDSPGARTFVNRLTRLGFITAYCRGTHSGDPRLAANSRASLPRWLQPDFLVAQQLQSDGLPVENPQTVENDFQRFLARNRIPLQIHAPMGDYYGPDVLTGRRAAVPLNFKMYVEGRALEAALQNGAIDQTYEQLRRDGAALRHLKLHRRNRLVFYFRSSILTAGPYA